MTESWNDYRATWKLGGKFYILGFGAFCTCKGQGGKDQGNEPGDGQRVSVSWSNFLCQL